MGWEQKLYSIIIIISINAQVFIEMCTLWLVTDHIISHHKQEVIIAGALNSKWLPFVNVSKGENSNLKGSKRC